VKAVYENAAFKKIVMDELAKLSIEQKLSGLEKPKDIYLTSDPFSVENGIITPTFKLKRNVGREVYKAQIDKMYDALIAKGL
jgi:long-chain acyl-CoA synthetase